MEEEAFSKGAGMDQVVWRLLKVTTSWDVAVELK